MNDLAEYLGFKKKEEKSPTLSSYAKNKTITQIINSPDFSVKAVRTPSTTSVDKLNQL